MVDQRFEYIAGNRAGKAMRFRAGHAPVDDFRLTGVMPQRRPGFQFMFAYNGHDFLSLGNEVDDSAIDFIEPVSQVQQFIGSQWSLGGHRFGFLTYRPEWARGILSYIPQLIDQAAIKTL